ncbi:MAG: hypothetical protein Q8P44_01570, partial [Dehalococcoidia bacterium]|nr:hypothetical protein [Dehalococcoidia bacterium]
MKSERLWPWYIPPKKELKRRINRPPQIITPELQTVTLSLSKGLVTIPHARFTADTMKYENELTSVIPAQAGIQESPYYKDLSWIPARRPEWQFKKAIFQAMTGGSQERFISGSIPSDFRGRNTLQICLGDTRMANGYLATKKEK